MCTTCGCVAPVEEGCSAGERDKLTAVTRTLQVGEELLARNARFAAANRSAFSAAGVFVVNLLSSPGSGKTTLLERTLAEQSGAWRCAALAADLQTSRDAERLAGSGVPVHQLNTGSACHLDAHMISHAVEVFDLPATDLLFIENVGNLVCPAAYDLGEARTVVLLSVSEGEDKPIKYPQTFRAADLLLLTKTDLLPHLDFALTECRNFARQVNPALEVIELSCRSGAGLNDWYRWLASGIAAMRVR